MNSFRLRKLALMCALLGAVLLAGCAPGKMKTVAPPAGTAKGAWVFRHAVSLDVPERRITLPFTGIMRYDATAGEARVVALGGTGMTLLDMTVDAKGHSVRFMHPSLAHVPRAVENAAAVIRFLWFGAVTAQTEDLAVLSAMVSDGWAKEITLAGKRFGVRITLLESRREAE